MKCLLVITENDCSWSIILQYLIYKTFSNLIKSVIIWNKVFMWILFYLYGQVMLKWITEQFLLARCTAPVFQVTLGTGAGQEGTLLNVVRDAHPSVQQALMLGSSLGPSITLAYGQSFSNRHQHPVSSQCLVPAQSKPHPDCCRDPFIWEAANDCRTMNNKSISRLPESFVSWCQLSWGKPLGIPSQRSSWVAVRSNLGERWETDLGLKAPHPLCISWVI